MIKVHHLNNSRSQRILWLLEELKLDYEIVHYKRDAATRLAPPELKAVHPLGKSPVITDGKLTVAESGAIVEYLIRTHGKGQMMPKEGTEDFVQYLHWMHFAEGSAMLPLLLMLYVGFLGEAGAPLRPRIEGEVANHLGYMESQIGKKDFFVGNALTGADIQLVFVLEAVNARAGLLKSYPNLTRYLAAMHARPAYKKGLEKGGPYELGR